MPEAESLERNRMRVGRTQDRKESKLMYKIEISERCTGPTMRRGQVLAESSVLYPALTPLLPPNLSMSYSWTGTAPYSPITRTRSQFDNGGQTAIHIPASPPPLPRRKVAILCMS
jgi:hypothetical protein